MKKILFAAMLSFCYAMTGVENSENLNFNLENKNLKVSNGKDHIIIGSRILVVKTGWEKVYFSMGINKLIMNESATSAQNKLMLSSVPDSKDDFVLNEYSVEKNNNALKIVLRGLPRNDISALIEHSAMVIPKYLIEGAEYTAVLANGSTVNGKIGMPDKFELINSFRQVTFKTVIGELGIKVDEGEPLCLKDRRVKTFMGYSCFWIGMGGPLKKNEEFRQSISLSLNPDIKPAESKPLPEISGESKNIEVDKICDLSKLNDKIPLIPSIKEKTEMEGKFYIPSKEDVISIVTDSKNEDVQKLKRAAERIFRSEMNIPVKADITISVADKAKTAEGVKNAKGISLIVSDDASIPPVADAYTMLIDENGILIKAKNPRGAFYGIQTARMLFNEGKFLAVKIKDWPDFAFRGLHLLADEDSLQFHSQIIKNVMVPLKMNHIVFEVEYAKWDSLKKLHRPWGMSKDDMKKLKDIADENFIEITPLFQTLGHCEWLFADNQNIDWAEDKDNPYAYDVSNPEVYKFMARVLDEVTDLFKPRYLHIGHDEVVIRGTYPCRDYNVKKGIAKLLYDDVMWYHSYAKTKNMKIMMWHDMLVGKDETSKGPGFADELKTRGVRDLLPKDIVIADWQYQASETFPEINALTKEGFEVIGSTWNEPGNLQKFSAYAKGKIPGMLHTTWTGYNGNKIALEKYFDQIAAYVKAGECFWDVDGALKNSYDPGKILVNMMSGKEKNAGPVKGKLIDISGKANTVFAPDSFGVEKFPLDPADFGGVMFKIASRNNCPAAIALKSRKMPGFPEKIEGITVDSYASSIYFLHFTYSDSQGETAKYKIKNASGQEYEIPVINNRNIGSILGADQNYYLSKMPVYEWKHNGLSGRIYIMEWKNPEPEKKIESISIISGNQINSIYLMGLSVAQYTPDNKKVSGK